MWSTWAPAQLGPSDLEEALRSCDVLHAAVELECLLLVASRLASARVHRSQLAQRVAYERHCHRHRVRHLVREALEVAQRRVDRREGGGRVEAERHHVRLGQVTLARVWVRDKVVDRHRPLPSISVVGLAGGQELSLGVAVAL